MLNQSSQSGKGSKEKERKRMLTNPPKQEKDQKRKKGKEC